MSTIFISAPTLIINLAIFFGLFFGLNYEEIVKNRDFLAAQCHIVGTKITSFYCPDVYCSGCDEAAGATPSCSFIKGQWSTINPATYGHPSINGSGATAS